MENEETEMQKYRVIIVGGGAAGMYCALRLADLGVRGVLLLERNERLGRKLSATGNGQGNITNAQIAACNYFSQTAAPGAVERVLRRYGRDDVLARLGALGGLFSEGEGGKIYPASRQAASVTDLFRFALARGGVSVRTKVRVRSAAREGNVFSVQAGERFLSDVLVLACGGCAAPHFGTEGDGYALAGAFGHTVTPLRPSLVQLKADPTSVRGLKGVRVEVEAALLRAGTEIARAAGDIIFTDYGVSGDVAFRLSAFAKEGDVLSVDFLPSFTEEEIRAALENKAADRALAAGDLFRCVVNSAVGRCILRRNGIREEEAAARLPVRALAHAAKSFAIPVAGNLGFDAAQVTKGGVSMDELDEDLMSRRQDGLYIVGELADVDGECGGYNLQWAFSSGAVAAEAIARRH